MKMRKRSKTLKIKTAKRDNFACQKCRFQDKKGEKLEEHTELFKENFTYKIKEECLFPSKNGH